MKTQQIKQVLEGFESLAQVRARLDGFMDRHYNENGYFDENKETELIQEKIEENQLAFTTEAKNLARLLGRDIEEAMMIADDYLAKVLTVQEVVNLEK